MEFETQEFALNILTISIPSNVTVLYYCALLLKITLILDNFKSHSIAEIISS